jgi:NADPH2:quinone reductase
MKAIRVHAFGGADVMRIEDLPDPIPGAQQLVISVKAAGVNPVDTYVRSGTYARKKPDLPYTPGFDAAGVVESVGAGVGRFRPGDRVFLSGNITGAYAQKTLCQQENAYPLPDRVTFAQGAGIWVPYATAQQALFHFAKARPGETVLVHGASGGVGIACVQAARAFGLRVVGSAGSEKGRELVRAQGAHEVLDHHAADFVAQVQAATAGRGPDIIVEMLANVNLSKDLTLIAQRGRIVIVGNRGTIEINPRDAMSKEAAIIGMILLCATAEETMRIGAALAAGLENGTLNPVVGCELPLEQARQAHEKVLAPGSYGKIVLVP